MFFWFFPALNKDTKAPLILWLEGGPGASDLFSLFVLNGPYILRKNLKADRRPQTWNKEFNVLYVDNPVGTGFSFTDDEAGYSKDQDQVAANLYEFLQQFFQVFHEYGRNDLYVAGQSYGGKYVPAIAHKIHVDGPPSQTKFKGIAIGNGLCDPENQLNYSDYYYQLGIIDRKQAEVIRNVSALAVEYIRNGKFMEALALLNNIVADAPESADPNYLLEFAGYNYNMNFLLTEFPEDILYFGRYVRLPQFRKAVHVGNLTFNEPEKVAKYLMEDTMKSIRPWLVDIMNNYKVLIYNGQLDLDLPYPPMTDFLRTLSTDEWILSDEYKNTDRRIWKLNGSKEVAGYVHNVGDFYQVLVRSAGHMVPYDQPEYGLDLITRFVKENL